MYLEIAQRGTDLKILQTPARFHPFVGGVENYVYYLCKKLGERGHDVAVICADDPRYLGKCNGYKFNVKRLHYVGMIANTNITPMLPLKLIMNNYDIIHTHLPTPWSADWSAFAAALKGKPLVVTYHNDIIGSGVNGIIAKIYNQTLLKLLLKKADRIIITHPEYLMSSSYLNSYSNKIEVVPVGVDTNKFRPLNINGQTSDLFFLSVLDEFHRYKGLDDLLKALQIVKQELPMIKLTIGGSGKLIEEYRKMACHMGLEHNVEFIGFIPDDKLVEYYNKSNVFVLPSTTPSQEGFGMVLLEAMACGKPVITTEIVGLSREICEYSAGEIIEPGSVRGLARAICDLIKDKDKAKSMGVRGRKLVDEIYSWDIITEKILKIYSRALNEYGLTA